jgi:hypothetical protein
MHRFSISFLAMGLALLSTQALGYVGPGAGLSLVGSFFALLLTILIAVGIVVSWPIRLLIKRLRNKKLSAQELPAEVVENQHSGLKPQTTRTLQQDDTNRP